MLRHVGIADGVDGVYHFSGTSVGGKKHKVNNLFHKIVTWDVMNLTLCSDINDYLVGAIFATKACHKGIQL